jgi:hypothetical protein
MGSSSAFLEVFDSSPEEDSLADSDDSLIGFFFFYKTTFCSFSGSCLTFGGRPRRFAGAGNFPRFAFGCTASPGFVV